MKKRKNPIDIVLVTWNRPELTERTIKTLAKNTITPSRLIVIDNCSDKKTKDLLIELKMEGFMDVLRLFSYNFGLETARDMGLRIIKSDLFVCCDNDILPEKPDGNEDWLSKLVDLMEAYPEYGAIAARTQVMIGTGNIFDGKEEEQVVEFSHPGGSLRIMRTDIVKRVGGWAEEKEGRGQEEMYICGKLREEGYKTGFAVNVKCYHMFGNDANWGYGNLDFEDHGHKLTWHPAIINGDDEKEIKKWLK